MFNSPYAHGFIRAAVAIPQVQVADPQFNLKSTCGLARRASQEGAAVVLFPELGLSAYSNDDLFFQDALLDSVRLSLHELLELSRDLLPVLLVGAPLRFGGALFNCAVALYRGRILGVVPKTYLPNYREFYEKRQFTSGTLAHFDQVTLLGQQVPFGNDLIFQGSELFGLHLEICEDVWAPIPPSTYAAMAGATVLANLSASNITVGKAEYRRDLCASQSGKCIAAYLYSAAGLGESTTDLAWDGHALIYENNERLAESERFSATEQLIMADLDLERLIQDRVRLSSFHDCAGQHAAKVRSLRRVAFDFQTPQGELPLRRVLERFPFVPSSEVDRDQRCFEAYNIQVHALLKRLQQSGTKKLVIGVSGGLDSTHALIVAAKTMDRLQLPRQNILAYTMPGFATSSHTLANARALMGALGCTAHELDIRPSCQQMLADLGHPYASGEAVYDVTFENVQAGERTSHLFRLANHQGALVLGTGDLSELALGWCTYGVGDHMSHYNVNASVPKTLIQHLIRWVIASEQFSAAANATLQSIVDTEISPELVPGGESEDQPSQSTEAKIGPYELQDFNLYYVTRYGFRPSKIAYLSQAAWSEKYSLEEIKKWLRVFLFRFFQISQFKRTCVPNAPKVGSGGSLSPRGDWRAPSDSEATCWLKELDEH